MARRIFYTVDRRGFCRDGLDLNLQLFPVTIAASAGPILQDLPQHLEGLFPDGLSLHGKDYLLDRRLDPNATIRGGADPIIEIFFEYVRRAGFPACPSRFQSIFACESIAEAVAFREKAQCTNACIWEIEAESESFFRGDMNLLGNGSSILVYSQSAQRYWRGLPGPAPFWEVLLVPPVRVLAKTNT